LIFPVGVELCKDATQRPINQRLRETCA